MILSANAISDGDKESECDEDGPSPEDSRKVRNILTFEKMLSLHYVLK